MNTDSLSIHCYNQRYYDYQYYGNSVNSLLVSSLVDSVTINKL